MDQNIKFFKANPEEWILNTILRPEKPIVFFVGAGISVNSGLPNFFEFSENFLSGLLPDTWKKDEIDQICRTLRPEVLIQVVQQVQKDRSLKFYQSLDSDKPNTNHYFLALALMAGHCVFTTNVDTLIERACEKIKMPCKSIILEEDYQKLIESTQGTSQIDLRSKLFKFHGSIDNTKKGINKFRSIRFVLNRVGLGLSEGQKKIFSTALRDYDFIFLGYSGNDHFSIQPVLLKTESNQRFYWFKFKPNLPKLAYKYGINYFKNYKEQLLTEAIEGKSSVVKWEDISILEILSNREKSILIEGDTSLFIWENFNKIIDSYPNSQIKELLINLHIPKSIQKDPRKVSSPKWTQNATRFERHILAAMLLIRTRNLSEKKDEELKLAEECANDKTERALVEKLRASAMSTTRRLGESKSSEKHLLKSIKIFEDTGDFISESEANLELANIKRINRNFESARNYLDIVENLLQTNKRNFQVQNRALDWSRLMAQLYHYRGLVYGLGQKGTFSDKLKAINYCNEAYVFAHQAGDVSSSAAILNARGLIIYQLAERSEGLLHEAENSLDEAFTLYTRIGDARGSFAPMRNRLLIQRLRILKSKSHAREYWLDKAQIDCQRAHNYLNQIIINDGEPSADVIEIKYRQAQLNGLKGEIKLARSQFREVLGYWEEKRDLHQQARIWQDLLSLSSNHNEMTKCLHHLLSLIESIFNSRKERGRYKNDLLRLENIRDMLIDAYLKAQQFNDVKTQNRIQTLLKCGERIAFRFDENLSHDFKIWSLNDSGLTISH